MLALSVIASLGPSTRGRLVYKNRAIHRYTAWGFEFQTLPPADRGAGPGIWARPGNQILPKYGALGIGGYFHATPVLRPGGLDQTPPSPSPILTAPTSQIHPV